MTILASDADTQPASIPLTPFFGRLHQLVRTVSVVALCLGMAAVNSSCAHSVIAGTQAKDTAANREVYDVLQKLRDALVRRDAKTLMTMVSKTYFEDCGTLDPHDDYGYLELSERLADDALSTAKDVSISFQIYDIRVAGQRAWADLRFTSRTRLELPGGRLWDSFRDFDRIEFVREDHVWRVVRGL